MRGNVGVPGAHRNSTAFRPEKQGFCTLDSRDLESVIAVTTRGVRDGSFCLIELRDSDMTADAATHFADRLVFQFCRGVVASVARFGARETREGENPANRLPAQRSARKCN